MATETVWVCQFLGAMDMRVDVQLDLLANLFVVCMLCMRAEKRVRGNNVCERGSCVFTPQPQPTTLSLCTCPTPANNMQCNPHSSAKTTAHKHTHLACCCSNVFKVKLRVNVDQHTMLNSKLKLPGQLAIAVQDGATGVKACSRQGKAETTEGC